MNIVEKSKNMKRLFVSEMVIRKKNMKQMRRKLTYPVRQIMSTPKHEEHILSYQFLKTTCTLNNKVFRTSVNSGSCENIVIKETSTNTSKK